MYKKISAEQYKTYFGLEDAYSIEGFFVYGAWDVEKYTEEIRNAVSEHGFEVTSRRLPSFLSDITELVLGGKTYWLAICYGSTKLSEYTHLACLFGAKWVLHLGSAGGLSKDLQALDLVIPDTSVSEDTVSALYASEYKNTDLKKFLRGFYLAQGVPVTSGASISIQAMMGESFSDIQQWSALGYVCVDMEASTIMAVSNYFNVPSASVLYVSDSLITEETVLSESYEAQSKKRADVKRILYSAVIEVLQNPPVFGGEGQ